VPDQSKVWTTSVAHFFAAKQIVSNSSLTIAYLPSVLIRNPAWMRFQILSIFWLKIKPMPFNLDGSIMSRVFQSGP
jgi:hypothetical protein